MSRNVKKVTAEKGETLTLLAQRSYRGAHRRPGSAWLGGSNQKCGEESHFLRSCLLQVEVGLAARRARPKPRQNITRCKQATLRKKVG